jgi:hypothetical protein
MEIYVLPLHSPPPPEEVHLSRLQLKVGPLADLRWWQTMQLAMQEMPARNSFLINSAHFHLLQIKLQQVSLINTAAVNTIVSTLFYLTFIVVQ